MPLLPAPVTNHGRFDYEKTWKELMWAFAHNEWYIAADKALELICWLDRGGTPPNLADEIPVGIIWNWNMARAGCKLALAQAAEHGAYTLPVEKPPPSIFYEDERENHG